jgi:hypothetical protein
MVYFMENERHAVDDLPNLYQPLETGCFCAMGACDRYYKDDTVFPKRCFYCEDVGASFGIGRRVNTEFGNGLSKEGGGGGRLEGTG